MARISLFRSSSIHLALIFTCLISLAFILFIHEMNIIEPGDAINTVTLYGMMAVLLTVAAGLFCVSYYVTKRINTILHTADTIIQTGDLSARIPIDNRWDDLSTLSTMLNTMISRIEESVAATRTVSDNIAHDLRTPLTRMRNRIEALSAHPCTKEQQPQHMQSLLDECDSLLSTFQALLRISRIETQHKKERFVSVPLHHVLEDVIELYEPLAYEKYITLTASLTPIYRVGDRDLLFQCFANILDNAIKHTPKNGTIHLALIHEKNRIVVTITDSGSGIPDAAKERVFCRFFRVDDTRQTPGNGLGLALVAAIVRLHQGQVCLRDAIPNGLSVHITL